jgi:hypothetical protein
MIKIKPKFPLKSVLFWLIILIPMMLLADKSSLYTYALSFIPVYYGSLFVRYFLNKIRISDEAILVSMNFEKFQIDLNKIKSFEVKKKSLWVQLLFGLPAETVQVEYNRYDTIQLFSADPALLKALSNKISREA